MNVLFLQYGKGRHMHYVIIQEKNCGLNISPTEATGEIGEKYQLYSISQSCSTHL